MGGHRSLANNLPSEIRPARLADLDTVLDILAEAARALRARGRKSWPDRFPPTFIRRTIDAGHVYVAWQADQAAGTLTLQPADPEIWVDAPDDALYLHRLAVRRAFAGSG